ncbi:hypothetical protein J6590_083819 [Homalodisca vitripennis]|nr:hypothetical protein J6590_083819 [Homalodisca vitripennis]
MFTTSYVLPLTIYPLLPFIQSEAVKRLVDVEGDYESSVNVHERLDNAKNAFTVKAYYKNSLIRAQHDFNRELNIPRAPVPPRKAKVCYKNNQDPRQQLSCARNIRTNSANISETAQPRTCSKQSVSETDFEKEIEKGCKSYGQVMRASFSWLGT